MWGEHDTTNVWCSCLKDMRRHDTIDVWYPCFLSVKYGEEMNLWSKYRHIRKSQLPIKFELKDILPNVLSTKSPISTKKFLKRRWYEKISSYSILKKRSYCTSLGQSNERKFGRHFDKWKEIEKKMLVCQCDMKESDIRVRWGDIIAHNI